MSIVILLEVPIHDIHCMCNMTLSKFEGATIKYNSTHHQRTMVHPYVYDIGDVHCHPNSEFLELNINLLTCLEK